MTPHFRQSLVLVALGGALGTAAREALVLGMPDAGPLPWPIVLANVAGAFLLGLLLASLHRRAGPGPSLTRGPADGPAVSAAATAFTTPASTVGVPGTAGGRPGLTQTRRLQLLLGTGFCGGFTTYSTLAVGMIALVGAGSHGVAWAAVYGLGTVFAGALATWAGLALGSRSSATGTEPPTVGADRDHVGGQA